jgi:type IV secretory pathway ATPase VirB11/archaellum biosynthesis ATPase
MLLSAIPPGVRLITIDDLPEERRRVSLVRLPGSTTPATDALVHALRRHAADLAE